MEIKTAGDLLTASVRGGGGERENSLALSLKCHPSLYPTPQKGGQVKETIGGWSDGRMTFQTNSRSTLALARSLRASVLVDFRKENTVCVQAISALVYATIELPVRRNVYW